MLNLHDAITAALDTPGVHPWNEGWHTAYDLFFDELKNRDIEGALNVSLDYIERDHGHLPNVTMNETTRSVARRRFMEVFTGQNVDDNTPTKPVPKPALFRSNLASLSRQVDHKKGSTK